MNYIVNPLWLYLASVSDGIKIVVILMAVISGSLLIAALLGLVEDLLDLEENETKSFLKKIIVCLVVSCTLSILIPDGTAIKTMIAASYVTEENVTAATNYGKDIVDYIFDKVNGEDDD